MTRAGIRASWASRSRRTTFARSSTSSGGSARATQAGSGDEGGLCRTPREPSIEEELEIAGNGNGPGRRQRRRAGRGRTLADRVGRLVYARAVADSRAVRADAP